MQLLPVPPPPPENVPIYLSIYYIRIYKVRLSILLSTGNSCYSANSEDSDESKRLWPNEFSLYHRYSLHVYPYTIWL